ncbi:MAG: hypothetical protein JW928_05200, partial [Candidatus Aureabacteria bacterium]|nr:hypothetical protein [Candidatus Auribacterota bacterium]
MKDNIIKKIKEKESCLKGDDIERTLSSIASRFHIDLDHITNASATVSASTRRVSAGTVTPKKRDIGYTGADESSDYGLLHLINKGSTSNIYLAEQISLKRKVALKIMSKDVPLQNEAIQQFFREAQITSSLSHPNIIPVHDAGIVPDGSPFYAMKSMQGLSWNSLLHPGNAELE